MTERNHTPGLKYITLPLRGDDNGEYIFDANDGMVAESRGWCWLSTFGTEQAADEQERFQDFIVRACNSHADLLAQRDALLAAAKMCEGTLTLVNEDIRANNIDPELGSCYSAIDETLISIRAIVDYMESMIDARAAIEAVEG